MESAPEPVRLTFVGEQAAAIRAEGILSGLEPSEVVLRALSLYLKVMPESRAGGELILRKVVTDNANQNRRGLRGYAQRLGDRVAGAFGEQNPSERRVSRVVQLDFTREEE